MRKGILYYLCLLIQRYIRKIFIIGYPTRPLYPRIGIGLGRFSINIFRKSASFTAHWVSIKVKVFTPKSAKVEVKT